MFVIRGLAVPAARGAVLDAGARDAEPHLVPACHHRHAADAAGRDRSCRRGAHLRSEGRGQRHDEPHRDILFLVLMCLGLPIAASLGLAAGAVILWYDLPLSVIAQRTVNSLELDAVARRADVHLRGQHLQYRRHHAASVRLDPHAGRPHSRRPRLCDDPHTPGLLRHFRRGARRHRRARQHPDPHDAPAGLQGRILRRHLHGGLYARSDLSAFDPARHLRDHRRNLRRAADAGRHHPGAGDRGAC